ncbi:hypothetical protein [Gordonia sp. CPCC 205333]|uniref:hypothetical protein n=1 Tax=Gordonia sp. CPCC 205333 TaxID=3140790 RepID=UPI003AF3BF24
MSSGHAKGLSGGRRALVFAGAGVIALTSAGHAGAGVSTSTSRYGTDCVYRLSLPVPSHQEVTFVESDVDGGRSVTVAGSVAPHDGVAWTRWVPAVHGERVLIAEQGGIQSVAVHVAVLLGGGPLCR